MKTYTPVKGSPAAQPFDRKARQNGNRKAQKRLNRRLVDWANGSTSREGKVQNRWGAGGYHKPGSMQFR